MTHSNSSAESPAPRWASTKRQVRDDMRLPRHRASTDAPVLQRAFALTARQQRYQTPRREG